MKKTQVVCNACNKEIHWHESAFMNVTLDVDYQTGRDPGKPMGRARIHIEGDFHYLCFDKFILKQLALKAAGFGTWFKHEIRSSWIY